LASCAKKKRKLPSPRASTPVPFQEKNRLGVNWASRCKAGRSPRRQHRARCMRQEPGGSFAEYHRQRPVRVNRQPGFPHGETWLGTRPPAYGVGSVATTGRTDRAPARTSPGSGLGKCRRNPTYRPKSQLIALLPPLPPDRARAPGRNVSKERHHVNTRTSDRAAVLSVPVQRERIRHSVNPHHPATALRKSC